MLSDLQQPKENNTELSYHDWINPDILWYSSRTVVVGISTEAERDWAVGFFGAHHADVFDLYRDPKKLIPNLYEFRCILRILDFATYLQVEDKVARHINVTEPQELTPLIVYGAPEGRLPQNVAVIDGSATHPKMLAAFFIFLTKRL